MKKNCLYCGSEFDKRVNCSSKKWLKTKFCSKKCFYSTGHSDETKLKISFIKKGSVAWNKGQKGQISEETKKKLSDARKGKSPSNKGKTCSEETKQKIKLKRSLQAPSPSGSNHHNWKGGKTKLVLKLRDCAIYKKWRSSIFVRDNFTCQICQQKGNKLNADHIKPFSLIIHENEIYSFEKGIKCEELWQLDNGRTLCVSCHRKTESYAINTKYQLI